MFIFTYLPQAAILAFTSGPLAALSAALLVLSESSTLTMVLSKAFLIEDSLIDTFDGTLIARGHPELVAKERQVKSGGAGDVIARLGKLAGKPFAKFTPQAIIRYFMFLPLNLIPVVGTVAFVLLQGKKTGPQAHNRYFQLKGMSKTQKEQAIEQRKAAYTRYVSSICTCYRRLDTDISKLQLRCSSRPPRDDSYRWNLLRLHQHLRRCIVGCRSRAEGYHSAWTPGSREEGGVSGELL